MGPTFWSWRFFISREINKVVTVFVLKICIPVLTDSPDLLCHTSNCIMLDKHCRSILFIKTEKGEQDIILRVHYFHANVWLFTDMSRRSDCAAPFFKNLRFSILKVPDCFACTIELLCTLLWRPKMLRFFIPSLALTSFGRAVLGGFGLGMWTSRSNVEISNR